MRCIEADRAKLTARVMQFDSDHFGFASADIIYRRVPYAGACTMSRSCLLILLITLTASTCQAAGSFQTKPAFTGVVMAGMAPPLPTIAMPNVSAVDFVGGCGRGRVRDLQTHGCRGPADIR
jgi:hypothetical protein